MKTKIHGGFTLLELLVVITIIGILASQALPALVGMTQKGHLAQASSNARQIAMALRSYAGDHNGLYPDADRKNPAQTANDAFRRLLTTGVMKDERIFGCAVSPHVPDADIGKAPDFSQALEPGENHWCMTQNLSDSSDGNAPLVFENPIAQAWPPTWNCDAAGRAVDGRAWRGGRIVIARNDGSVGAEELASIAGDSVGLRANAAGEDLFTQLAADGQFLDIQR